MIVAEEFPSVQDQSAPRSCMRPTRLSNIDATNKRVIVGPRRLSPFFYIFCAQSITVISIFCHPHNYSRILSQLLFTYNLIGEGKLYSTIV
jgi:hypothetical protein